MAVPALIRSGGTFIKGTFGAIAAAVAAVSDPLKWPQAVGFMTDWHWTVEPWQRQAFCAAIAFVWMFVWYHRQRSNFEASQPAKHDMPLHQAVRYIATESAWAASTRPDDDDSWVMEVSRELKTALAAGRVQAWGRLRKTMEETREATTLIPVAELQHFSWEAHLMVAAIPPAWFNIEHSSSSYRRVHLNRAQVEAEWPRRSLWARLRRCSPIERLSDSAKKQGSHGYKEIFAKQDENYFRTPYTALILEFVETAAVEEVFQK